jgi:hypothetical protein
VRFVPEMYSEKCYRYCRILLKFAYPPPSPIIVLVDVREQVARAPFFVTLYSCQMHFSHFIPVQLRFSSLHPVQEFLADFHSVSNIVPAATPFEIVVRRRARGGAAGAVR